MTEQVYRSRPCTDCGQPIIMARARSTGRWMPVDAAPSTIGNILLSGTSPVADVHRQPVPGGRASHHHTCAERNKQKDET